MLICGSTIMFKYPNKYSMFPFVTLCYTFIKFLIYTLLPISVKTQVYTISFLKYTPFYPQLYTIYFTPFTLHRPVYSTPSYHTVQILPLTGLNRGVSDHHKDSPEPIIFWKHQCALTDHNIFMKRIGLVVVILNHSEFFLRAFLYFCAFLPLEFFSCLKPPTGDANYLNRCG